MKDECRESAEELTPEEVTKMVAERVKEAGGKALLTGGCVRDEIIREVYPEKEVNIKDYDLEIYGLDTDKLYDVLSAIAKETGESLDEVGRSFGIIKLGNLDISIPRRDSKSGKGHRGFDVNCDPWMSIKEAAQRRDLTINSMAKDPLTSELFDYYGGVEDIKNGVLRATDPEKFKEDPLRVLRVVQFAGRFGFTPDTELVKTCRLLTQDPALFYPQNLWAATNFLLEYLALHPEADPFEKLSEVKSKLAAGDRQAEKESLETEEELKREIEEIRELLALGKPIVAELPKARLGEEWRKLLLKSTRPSTGLRVASDIGLLKALNPELEVLASTPQDREWHPEGNVWEHTLLAVDAAAKLVQVEGLKGDDALVIMLASLLHDSGKPQTTTFERGKLRSLGHEQAGAEPAKTFLNKTEFGQQVEARVIKLVTNHMRTHDLWQNADVVKDGAIRKLAKDLYPATIKELVMVSTADHMSREAEWDGYPAGEWLLQKAEALQVTKEPPQPLLMGRDLLSLGMESGPRVGEALKMVEKARLDDAITTKKAALELLYNNGYIKNIPTAI